MAESLVPIQLLNAARFQAGRSNLNAAIAELHRAVRADCVNGAYNNVYFRLVGYYFAARYVEGRIAALDVTAEEIGLLEQALQHFVNITRDGGVGNFTLEEPELRQFDRNVAYAHYCLGVITLARGERTIARGHFEAANQDARARGSWPVVAETLLARWSEVVQVERLLGPSFLRLKRLLEKKAAVSAAEAIPPSPSPVLPSPPVQEVTVADVLIQQARARLSLPPTLRQAQALNLQRHFLAALMVVQEMLGQDAHGRGLQDAQQRAVAALAAQVREINSPEKVELAKAFLLCKPDEAGVAARVAKYYAEKTQYTNGLAWLDAVRDRHLSMSDRAYLAYRALFLRQRGLAENTLPDLYEAYGLMHLTRVVATRDGDMAAAGEYTKRQAVYAKSITDKGEALPDLATFKLEAYIRVAVPPPRREPPPRSERPLPASPPPEPPPSYSHSRKLRPTPPPPPPPPPPEPPAEATGTLLPLPPRSDFATMWDWLGRAPEATRITINPLLGRVFLTNMDPSARSSSLTPKVIIARRGELFKYLIELHGKRGNWAITTTMLEANNPYLHVNAYINRKVRPCQRWADILNVAQCLKPLMESGFAPTA